MTEPKEPSYAPGQELTLHPGDPVKGADVLAEAMEERGEQPPAPRREERDDRTVRFF